MTEIKKDIAIMEDYNLNAEMLFVLKLIFEIHDSLEGNDGNHLNESRENYSKFFHESMNVASQKAILKSLMERGVLKTVEIPDSIKFVEAEKLSFNKVFLKKFRRFSLDMGQELWDAYPKLGYVNEKEIPLTSLKTFNSEDELFSCYAKMINYDEEKHRKILKLIEWAKETKMSFINMNIESFVKGRVWEAIEEFNSSGDMSYSDKLNEYARWV